MENFTSPMLAAKAAALSALLQADPPPQSSSSSGAAAQAAEVTAAATVVTANQESDAVAARETAAPTATSELDEKSAALKRKAAGLQGARRPAKKQAAAALPPTPPSPPRVKSEAEVEAAAQHDAADLARLLRYYDEELVVLERVVEQQTVMRTRGGFERLKHPPRTVTRLMLPKYEEDGYAERLHALLADNQRGAALNMLRAIERSESTVDVQPPDAACFGKVGPPAEMDLDEAAKEAAKHGITILEPSSVVTPAVDFVDMSTDEAEARAMAEVAAAAAAAARRGSRASLLRRAHI